ncbi:MAG: glycosyltransferase family 4 protein [Alphaproteobacteria bacterium]|nr:glycosyltransferase family 4 protein [Alphaproteobacteria bacterium]
MRIAFYAPLKPPDHAVASGDRRVGQLLFRALEMAGDQPFIAARLRSFDATGDTRRQGRMARLAQRVAVRLLTQWQPEPRLRPQLWFTYHLYHKAPDWLGPTIANALGIPYVAAEASFAPKQEGGPWALGHRAVAGALRRADAVIGLNPADRACVTPMLRDPARYHPLLPFLDTRGYVESLMSGRPPRLITVAMMRRGDKLTSYRLLGEALVQLLDLEWTLDIVGDGPAWDDVVRALAPLGNRVTYLGALADTAVAAALGGADAMVWPAINEAFGMALLEAQASGLPVVAGESGGVSAIVANGETGWLASPGDGIALAGAVRRLLENRDLRLAMGRAARDKTLRLHDLANAGERLRDIIDRLRPARAA